MSIPKRDATPPTKNSLLFTIILTVFIDMLGVTVIIPVIPVLFFGDSSIFFTEATPETTRSVLYGLLLAAYPVLQFFGAPFLGGLSDRYGRRPVLTISLIGTMIGYVLFAIAILNQNLYLLFFSRMLPGFTGGNIAVILSAIADVSSPAEKAKNFGLVGAAFGIGFILGPTLGGFLADDSLISWFNATTPFWFVALLTLFNIILVQLRFPETLKERRVSKTNLLSGVNNIVFAFKVKNLRQIFVIVLLISLGFTFFTQFFSVYLIQEFSYTEKDIGLLYGWVGIWLVIAQGVIVRKMSGRVASTDVLRFSIFGIAFTIGLLVIPTNSFWFYLINPLIALAYGLTSPNLTSVVSEQALPDQQGQVLGINQSMQSLGQALPPIVGGYLNSVHHSLPLIAGSALLLIAWAMFVWFFKGKNSSS